MKKVRKISKKYYLRQIMACWLVSFMAFGIPAQIAMASTTPGQYTVPTGFSTTGGINTPVISGIKNETMNIAQTASEAIINWTNFDIGSDASVTFAQPAVTAAVLNRVSDGDVTGIMGTLAANGRVFIINPAGIVFGSGATINVAQLVASSLDILDADFLDGLPYTFTGGATAGDVINLAADITAERLYLIGKRVGNRGALVADDYVIMAAGETVLISENSPVVVEVSMPEQTPGEYDYIVDNGGGPIDFGDGYIDADHVILAAGDIWSTAITNIETLRAEAKGNAVFDGEIYAYAESASDAVADITIITGGDFYVNSEIMAEADATGGGDNAIAGVTIDAGGDVQIDALVKAEADAESNAGNATATVDIIADGSVTILDGAEGEDVQADVWVVDSGDGTATVNISAGGYVDIYGYIKAEAEGDNSGNMSATVDISSADASVDGDEFDEGVYVYDDAEVLANAEAENGSGNATAEVLIDAVGNVEISDYVKAEADAESGSGDATALVDISAGGYVNSDTEDDYAVQADVWVDEDSGDGTATVNISAGGYVDIYGDVSAEADTRDNSGNAVSKAEINADGDVYINERFRARSEAVDSGNATADTIITGQNIVINEGGSNTAIITKAITNGNTVNTGDAVGNTVIAAREDVTVNGNIKNKVSSNDAGNASSDIKISGVDIDINSKVISRAQAGFHYLGEYESEDGDSGNATAGIDIAASGIVNVDDVVKSNAEAENNSGSASATTKIVGTEVNIEGGESNEDRHGNDIDQSVVALASTYDNSGNATANVDIEATTGNVLIDTDGYAVLAEATVENPDNEYTGDADAGVTITADGDVDIYDLVKAEADAENNAGDATATVDITADGSVIIHENGEDYMVQADVWVTDNSGSGQATLNITALGGDVDIYDDVKAEAETRNNSGNATATLDIEASGNVNIYENEDDTVTARASVENPDNEYDGDATATLNITTGADGDVSVYDDVEAEADTDGDAGDATATVTVDAGGDLTIDDNGEIVADADARNNSGNASATVDIDAGNVTVDDEGYLYAQAYTTNDSGNATALVDIDTGNVGVYGNGYLYAEADAQNNSGDADADVDIDAGGDVTVVGGIGEGTEGHIYAEADTDEDSGDSTADVDIDAVNVTVEDGYIYAEAVTDDRSGNATATVDITASGTDTVTVGAYGEITAETEVDNNGGPEGSSSSATSVVVIDSAGDVIVDEDGRIYADADVDNYDNEQINTFTGNADADVYITALGVVIVDGLVKAEADVYNKDGYEGGEEPRYFPGDIYSGNSYANVTIDNLGLGFGLGLGLGVTVGPDGEIIADSAFINYDYPDGRFEDNVYSGEAFAGIDIQTCDDVIVDGLVRSVAFIDPGGTYDANPTNDDYLQTMDADVIVKAFGDVIVNSENEVLNGDGSNGQIEAVASNGKENTAGITVLAVGDVIVNNGSERGHQDDTLDSPEEIMAAAYGGSGSTNNADVRIATREGFGGDVIVSGQIGARTWIQGEGGSEHTNTSVVEIFADQDVIVEGGYALYGQSDGTVLLESHEGGQIFAGAQGSGPQVKQGESLLSSNTAEVDIYAGRDVIVHGAELEYIELIPNGGFPTQGNGGGFLDGGQIIALIMPTERNNYNENTTHVGIYAQRDVTIDGPTVTGEPMFPVQLSPKSSGQVIAGSHGNNSINDAEIEICAQDDVTIDGVVEATAGTGAGLASEHYAHIRIAAGDQLAGGPGGSIIADADPDAAVAEASVTFFVTGLGNLGFDGLAYSTTDRGHTQVDPEVVVGPVDCPDCDFDWIDWLWCVDCEPPVLPVAGAVSSYIWTGGLAMNLQGCPVEIEAAANELGITPGAMQVSIGNALALNPTLQACNACATLIDAALVLRDEDGSRMAAMTQMFNSMAPASAPYTPEMQALIATAFAGAAEGSQYATVMEYTDAFVRYFSILQTDLASPVGDSLAFVMDKYGADVLGSDNNNIAAFIATRLESGETFGD